MTRLELLKIVVGRARTNGFEFRRWYTTRMSLPWISAEASLTLLESQRRYYALLFSHEFAESFWKPGTEITFQVGDTSFERRMADGTIATVTRKPFVRRSARRDAWRFHLKEMALAEEPLRYIRRYLAVDEELDEDLAAATVAVVKPKKPRKVASNARTRATPIARPLPEGLPEFLKKPYA
ncbi:MAG: hypothetical protein PW792_06835 [Acidobacteriaceae bacterium]|nr:hypothetical protein [Acidobacteriaceae bacterium]